MATGLGGPRTEKKREEREHLSEAGAGLLEPLGRMESWKWGGI